MSKKDRHLMTAILSYLSVLVFIPLLIISPRDRDAFIRFHLRQGLALLTVEILAWFAFILLTQLPVLGMPFSYLWHILQFVFLFVAIVAIIKAVNGEYWKIPFVSEFSDIWKLR